MAQYLPLIITALTISCATSPDYVSPVSPVKLVDKVSCGMGRNTRSEVCVTNLDGFIRYHKQPTHLSPSNGRVTKSEFLKSYERLVADAEEPIPYTPLSGTPISRTEFADIKRWLSRQFDGIDVNGDGSIDKKDDANNDNMITAEDI